MAGIDESGAAEGEPPRLGRTPKEGERILAPTRRPDGTFRKPIRIRAGYTPPDEVAIYQSKGARMKKSAEADPPPGYDPVLDAKPKTKSAKRNERKKEKKLQQAALVACDGKGKSLDAGEDQNMESQRDSHLIPSTKQAEQLESVTCEMSKLSVLSTHSMVAKDKLLGGLNPDPRQSSNPESSPAIILDKKIRALKKKVYFKATDPFSERWQSAWVITAFWDILAFALLCVICYLWAPSQSSQRYAYSEDIGEDTDEEVQTLTKHLSEGDIGLAKTGRRDGNMRTTDAFTLEDELEEDKRE